MAIIARTAWGQADLAATKRRAGPASLGAIVNIGARTTGSRLIRRNTRFSCRIADFASGASGHRAIGRCRTFIAHAGTTSTCIADLINRTRRIASIGSFLDAGTVDAGQSFGTRRAIDTPTFSGCTDGHITRGNTNLAGVTKAAVCALLNATKPVHTDRGECTLRVTRAASCRRVSRACCETSHDNHYQYQDQTCVHRFSF